MALTGAQQTQLESIAIDFVFAAWQKYQDARARAVNAGIDPATLDAAMKVADAQLQAIYIQPPTPLITIAPTPSPVVDPTSIEYATLVEARMHLGGQYVNVYQLADGKFIVWPQLSGAPGTKVYP